MSTFCEIMVAVRADRLVATLLFLQSRGRVTATEVAEELEVSIRTARRDLEALSIAGIPVYSQAGRGGGWSLVGGARTDLSGLTAAEARTLFLIAGPSSAVTPEAKAALRKLVQALPETFRAEAEKAASAIVLDPARWGDTAPPPPPHLEALQQAVVQGVQVRLGYSDRSPLHDRTHGAPVRPGRQGVGVVPGGRHRRGHAHVPGVAGALGRAHRRAGPRPAGFDLAETWQAWWPGWIERRGSMPRQRPRRSLDRGLAAGPFRHPAHRWPPRRRRPRRRRDRLRAGRQRGHGTGRLQLRPGGARPARAAATSSAAIGARLVERYGPPAEVSTGMLVPG